VGSLIRSFVIAVLAAVATASVAQQEAPLGVGDIPQMLATHEANVARFQTTYRSRQFEGVGRVEAISRTADPDLFAVEISVGSRSRVRCSAAADLAAIVDRGSDINFRGIVSGIGAPGVVLEQCAFTKPVRTLPNTSVASAKPGTVFRDCEVCPEMVVIPGGSFLMGSPPGVGDDDERPQRRVTIAPFALGRTEVTQGLPNNSVTFRGTYPKIGF
jgi:formylglycine-generating enzyme required for sulfatase activity